MAFQKYSGSWSICSLTTLPVTIVTILSITVISMQTSSGDTEIDKVCLSKECINTAAKILSYMKPSVDPCEEFYDFSCGNFMKITNIPDTENSVTAFSEIKNLVIQQLRMVLEEPIESHEPRAFVLAKSYYKACIDIDTIEQLGLTQVHALLKQFGGWPAVMGNAWDETNFDWLNTIGKMQEAGFFLDFFVALAILFDEKNSSRYMLRVDEANLALHKRYLVNGVEDNVVKGYYNYMVDMATMLGANATTAKAELLESVKFEIELAKIKLPTEDRHNPEKMYNPMEISTLQERYNFIPWLKFLNIILGPYVTLTYEDIISVAVPEYLTKLAELIKKTPKRVLANHIIWRAMMSMSSFLTSEVSKRHFILQSLVLGQTTETPRWKQCVEDVKGSLSMAIGALYIRNYFSESAKKSMETLISRIFDEFKITLDKIDWMDPETKANALKKLASIHKIVGYPNELSDNAELDKYHKELQVDEKQYLQSYLNVSLFNKKKLVSKLRMLVNKTNWMEHPDAAVVNAYYNRVENSIYFPAGILQGVFFNEKRPNYMNYGGIGCVITHEITHGFDNQGRQYNEAGMLVNWWSNETLEAYNTKTKCMVEQYSNITVEGINIQLNGKNTLSENIADIGGIKNAYTAYEKILKEKGEEQSLPGLDYNNRQMFWIAAGIAGCSKLRKETLKMQVLTDAHAPHKYRLRGLVANMPEFARDFNCSKNSKMNPDEKCYLW